MPAINPQLKSTLSYIWRFIWSHVKTSTLELSRKMPNDNLVQRKKECLSVYQLQKGKMSWAILIHFLQQHNLFLRAIINLPENLAPSQLMRLRSIKKHNGHFSATFTSALPFSKSLCLIDST